MSEQAPKKPAQEQSKPAEQQEKQSKPDPKQDAHPQVFKKSIDRKKSK